MDFDAQNIKSNILWRSQSFFKMREKLETIISISKLLYFKIILGGGGEETEVLNK